MTTRLPAGRSRTAVPAMSGVQDVMPLTAGDAAGDIRDSNGIVYRYFSGYGFRFHPLMSFSHLNERVSAHDAAAARRLASALVARGVRRGDVLYWEYDFPYGGPVPWTSGFVQAVAAQALARTGLLVADQDIVKTNAARQVVADLEVATRTLLPRFDLGCWSRYALGGGAADLHYHTYHVQLLHRLSATHPQAIWRTTYADWSRCLP